jgi:hypothetical protein
MRVFSCLYCLSHTSQQYRYTYVELGSQQNALQAAEALRAAIRGHYDYDRRRTKPSLPQKTLSRSGETVVILRCARASIKT